jgi:hypothetical protein
MLQKWGMRNAFSGLVKISQDESFRKKAHIRYDEVCWIQVYRERVRFGGECCQHDSEPSGATHVGNFGQLSV